MLEEPSMSNYEDYPEVSPSQGKQVFNVVSEPGYSAIPHPRPEASAKSHKRICGLTAGVFAIVVGLVALLIGAAVGGGVGGSAAVKHCNSKLQALQTPASPVSTLSPSPTSSSTFNINYSLPIPDTSCGKSNFNASYTTESNFVFDKTCSHEYVGSDIVAVVALNWELCMEVCGRYNAYKNASSLTTCVGVAFVPSWIVESNARSNISNWSNCFLKYKVPDLNTVKSSRNWEVVVSTLRSQS